MNTLYMIGSTHFDPAWLWTWDEAMAGIRATFRAALERMEEDGEFVYSFCTPAVFDWIRETDPELFEKIRQRVAEGRWDIEAEGWWLQPDCNAPSGESLIRQGLYGQRYLMEHFGKRATTVFNFDSFGHGPMLPQILKKCGLEYYVFSRPAPKEQQLEKELFAWRSADGSQVLAFRADADGVGKYHRQAADFIRMNRERLNSCDHDLMVVYGVSDHGGAPTRQAIRDIHEMNRQFQDVSLKMASTTAFFEAQKEQVSATVTGELMTRYYGVFSNKAEIKRNNRRAEYAVSRAEKASCFTEMLGCRPYPGEKLNQCWKDIMFNQFHDILGGACIPECYDDARDLHGRAIQSANEITHFALQSITRQVKMLGNNQDSVWNLCIFNPNAVAYSGILEAEVQWIWEFPWYFGGIELVDETGAVHPTQIITERSKVPGFRSRFAFHADIPAFGYRTYAVRKTEREIRRDFGETDIRSPFVFRAFEDNGDIWCFKTTDGYGKICEEPVLESRKTVEKGELVTTVKQVWRFRSSILEEYITRYSGSDMVDYRYRVNWNEKQLVLKLIPTGGKQPDSVLAAAPGGSILRPMDGREYPVGQWMRWGEGVDGVTLLLDGIFAYNTGDYPQLTVLRSPIYGDMRLKPLREELDYQYLEQGITSGRIRLIPEAVSANAAAAGAMQWNDPPVVVCEANHGGTLPPTAVGLTMEPACAVVTALKKAEDGGGYVLRLTEYDGTGGRTRLQLGNAAPAQIEIAPYEIKTLRFLPDGSVRETNMLEE